MKRIFYSLLFAGTVWTAASQNPPEIKTPDRKAAERIEEYYLSKMLPDSMQLKAPSLYPADYFSPSTTMTPVISMSSLMEIRTKYALRRIDIVPYKVTQRLVLDFQRPGPELESLSGRASSTPGPSRFPYRGNDPDLALCGWSSRTTVPFFQNRHSDFPRSESAPGKIFRFPTPASANFGYLCVTDSGQKNRFFAHLLMCSL